LGGQRERPSRIENYMGFPTGISGADLLWRGVVQAMKFGARFAIPLRVTTLEAQEERCLPRHLREWPARPYRCNRSRERGAVSANFRWNDSPNFEGSGVYYSATEMEARYCKDTEAVIIGAAILPVKLRCSYAAIRSASVCWCEVPRSPLRCRYLTSRLEADSGYHD